MITQNLSCTTTIKYYEELRFRIIAKEQQERNNLGLSLFLHKGMSSWMNTCQQYIPQVYLNDAHISCGENEERDSSTQINSDVKATLASIIANIIRQNTGDTLCHQI